MDLSEFLLARIAEDEAGAATARDGDHWHGRNECDVCDATYAARDKYGDPARVLAECEAKRAIVELHAASATGWNEVDGEPVRYCVHCHRESPCPTLRLLALPHADHADHDEAWQMEVAA